MKLRATLIGFTAILMWSFLALFTAASGKMPPFQLSAVCFAIGSIPGLVVLTLDPSRLALLKQPAKVWITGISGLFGYHFLYFTALRNAPAVEAGLIAYLWPLLIVVGSALLPGERLRWYHEKHPQQRRLASARWTRQELKGFLRNVEGQVPEDFRAHDVRPRRGNRRAG